MAGFRLYDDLISYLGRQSAYNRLAGGPRGAYYVDPQGVARNETQDFLKQLADMGMAEDFSRGSSLALRARNAQRPFLDELADADLTPEPQLTPRDLARKANDDARRDAQYGPFEAGSPGVMWDIRRSAERNLAAQRAARAAEAESRAARAQDIGQFLGNTAMAAGATTALGTATANAIMSARERAAKEQQAANAFLNEQDVQRTAEAEEADLQSYGEWDDEAALIQERARAAGREARTSPLAMSGMDPLGDMAQAVRDMPMNFDLPPAPAQSQSDTARLKSEYKTPPGAPVRRRR